MIADNDHTSPTRVGLLTFEYGHIRCGGMGTVVTSLARSMNRKLFQPVVVLPRSGHNQSSRWRLMKRLTLKYVTAECFDDNGVEVWLLANTLLNDDVVYPQPYEYTGIKKTDEYGERVADLLPHLDLALVHLHDAYGYKCLREVRRLQLPSITTIHRLHDDEPPLALGEIVAIELADRVTTVSSLYRSERADVLGSRADVDVIENGIDLDFWRPGALVGVHKSDRAARLRQLLDSLQLAQDVTFVFVGRLDSDQKGVDVLLDCLATIPAPARFNVILAGDGDRELKERIAVAVARAPQSIRAITRELAPEEVRDLFAAADAVLVPSRYEPFGIVLLEAMAMGAIPIVTETGGLATVLEGVPIGKLIPPGDADALAAALEAMSTFLRGPTELIEAHRAAATARASHYAAHRMSDSYCRLYRRSLNLQAAVHGTGQ